MYQDPRHGYRPPVHGPPYPPPHHGHYVTRTGLSGGAHAVHAILTFFTCGLWAFVWVPHAIFARRKHTTHY